MARAAKRVLWIVAVLLVMGCTTGSGCSTCSGVTPLAEGFKLSARVENAASVRITDSGLRVLQDSLPTLLADSGGLVVFDIPSGAGAQFGIYYATCPGGPNPNADPPTCSVEVDLGNAALQVETTPAHNIHVWGTLPVRMRDLPLHITYFDVIERDINATLTGNGGCPGESQTFQPLALDVDISIEIDPNELRSRYGYSRVKIVNLAFDNAALRQSLHFCGGFDASILNGLKSILFDMLVGPLLDTLQTRIEDQLCQRANPSLSPACPTGTQDNGDGICRYGTGADAECASRVLGADGHVDISGLLAGVSPTSQGGLDFLFAAGGAGKRDDNPKYSWGDLNPVGGGATLGMYGGVEPAPASSCVPFSDMAQPTAIPIPDELLANALPDWPTGLAGPHVGFALSERFANYALNQAYNSGMLCIGVSTDAAPLLNSGTLRLLIPSLATLTLQGEAQPVALVIRPGAAPTVAFGSGTDGEADPLIRVKMPKASFDFYVWSLDRYIRFMSATFDLDVPMNLAVTPEGLQPILSTIGVDNGTVGHATLLRETPSDLLEALEGLIETQVGSALATGVAPIDLGTALASTGLVLSIPESVEGMGSPGIRKLIKGTDSFLGIFGVLAPTTPMTRRQFAETSLTVGDKRVDPAGLRVGSLTAENGPSLTIQLDSWLDDDVRPVEAEYQWRVDSGPWSPFVQRRVVELRAWGLRLQGAHTIAARARLVGRPETLDPTPATVEVVVDAEAPTVTVDAVGADGEARLIVRDLVSSPDAVVARFRLDSGQWSTWTGANTPVHVGGATSIEVEAKDAEGNVRHIAQSLVRAKTPAASSSCGCSVPGHARPGAGALATLLGVVIAFRRRRRASQTQPVRHRLLGAGSAAALALAFGSWAGCSCGDVSAGARRYSCEPPSCRALEPGLIGAYTSAVVSESTLWVAGYLEADWNHENPYGDLVVGTWDGEKVDWAIVDGVPDAPPADTRQFDKNGFRGGQTEPGPDVGLYTSIAVDDGGRPAVAYYDRTNRALKFAQLVGERWQSHTVEVGSHADVGRYAKLLFVDGAPIVAYLVIAPGDGGVATSRIRIGRAVSSTPVQGDWVFDDAVVDSATGCRSFLCGSAACVASTGTCVARTTGCDPECGAGQACVDLGGGAACAAVYESTKLDTYPEAVGDFISLAVEPNGDLALCYYDRIHGNLEIASNAGGAWARRIVDGQDEAGADTGNVGVGATLAIDDAGAWHIAYVDATNEALRYVRLAGGAGASAPEVVDTGSTLAGVAFGDGRHIVGDDARIAVSGSGEILISYQDATAGTLRYAVGTRTEADEVHLWTQRSVEPETFGTHAFAGAFSIPIELDGTRSIVSWWRRGGERVEGDVALVTP